MRWIVCAALVVVFMVGCSPTPKQTTWEGEAKANAVYATQLPLYPGAKVTEMMGSDTYGDKFDDHAEGMAWWFEVTATQAELDAWYATHLPGASKTTDDTGAICYTLTPAGGESGEDMGVRLADKELRVFEHTKAGKHKG